MNIENWKKEQKTNCIKDNIENSYKITIVLKLHPAKVAEILGKDRTTIIRNRDSAKRNWIE